MASNAVTAAFAARLAANWTGTQILEPNSGGDLPPSPFLAYEFPVANEEQITVGAPGANVFRETGACRVILSLKAGTKIDPWMTKIDALRSHFRGVIFNGVTAWSASPPATDDNNDQGATFRLSFAIPYQFDVIG